MGCFQNHGPIWLQNILRHLIFGGIYSNGTLLWELPIQSIGARKKGPHAWNNPTLGGSGGLSK